MEKRERIRDYLEAVIISLIQRGYHTFCTGGASGFDTLAEQTHSKLFANLIIRGGHKLEVKINREIRDYTESMFFGLSLRQFVFSLLAVGVAVGLYFLLRPHLGTETVSWVCILGAAPFAALGFVSYHGMTAEQFLWAWVRSELLEPKQIRFEPVNLYYEALKEGKQYDTKY